MLSSMIDRIRQSAPWVFTIQGAVLLSLGLVVPVLLVSTFASSTGAGRLYGYPEHLAWTLPVSLDVVALIGTLVASQGYGKGLRRYALVLVYVPLAFSWVANALDHVTRTPGDITHTVISGVLAGAPPVALVACLHLAMAIRNARQSSVTQTPDKTVTAEIEVITPDVTPQVSPVMPLHLVGNGSHRPDLDAMTVEQIRDMARDMGVAIRGSKAEIASRIRNAIEVA
jgi:hypothetical protein